MTLTELFNPSFFMLLGILLLAISFLIFYFENKAREQNHKINSMFSLVSSITEELNNANMRIHYLINGQGIQIPSSNSNSNSNIHSVSIPLNTYSNENKIEVSDGEDEDDDIEDEDEDEETDDEDDEDEEDVEDQEDEDEEDEEDDMDDDKTYYHGTSNKEKPVIPTLEELSDLDEDDSMNGYEEKEQEEEKEKEDKRETPLEEQIKSIHISLDKTNESIDYKKLSVQQLKNIVVQKGLAAFEEANRMKKGELHKLLGELNV